MKRGASTASGLAGKIDAIVPHPKNGGLQNVVDVLAAPFTGGRVVANVSNPTLKKGLELISNNPLKTAAVGAGVASAARYAAPSVARVGSSALSKVSKFASKSGISGPKGGGISTPSKGIESPAKVAAKVDSGIVGPSTTGGVAARSGSPRRSSSRRVRKGSSKRRSKTHRGTAKQYARKGGKKVYYAKKTGQPYIRLANGQARFIKGKRKKR